MRLRKPSRCFALFLTGLCAGFFSCGLAQAGVYSNAVLDSDPLVYWRLDDGDMSDGAAAVNSALAGSGLGSLADGTYKGTVSAAPGPLYGSADSAATFGATTLDYVILNPFPGGQFPTTDISVEFWLKTTGSGDGIVSYAPTNGENNEVLMFDPDNLRPHYNNVSTPSTGVDLNDGRWHHVVSTWRSSDGQVEVYHNGVREYVQTGFQTGASLTGGGSLVLAQEQDAVGGGFDSNQRIIGSMDEVALYDRVLTADEVRLHHLAARSGVVAGNISVPTASNDAGSVWTVSESGPGTMTITSTPNLGDAEIGVGGSRLLWSEGVMMASVREFQRDGTYGNVEVGNRDHFNGDSLGLATSRAGAGGGAEKNINVGVAYFPFAGLWTGAHVGADGQIFASRGITQDMLTQVPTTASSFYYELRMPGVDSIDDGMLFAVGGSNEDNIATTYPMADGSGWVVNVQDSNLNFTSEPDDFSVLYMPYSFANVVGGLIDRDGTVMRSAGDFTMTRTGTGNYTLTIPGKTAQDGVLLLTVADDPGNPLMLPDDNMLFYEGSGSDFLIRARDLEALTAGEDTRFVFAYVDFQNPPHVPEPAGLTLLVLGAAALLGCRRRRPARRTIDGNPPR